MEWGREGFCQGPSTALAMLLVQDRLGHRGEMVSQRLSHASNRLSRQAHAGKRCSEAAGVLHK